MKQTMNTCDSKENIFHIRNYTESDAGDVGRLIADTYSEFNLSFASPEDRRLMLGPFCHAHSPDKVHQKAIVEILRSPMFYIAEVEGEIAGILRGRKERLASLFVRKNFHHQGVGRKLVKHFEAESLREGTSVVRVAATLYAIPFYLKLGYKKSCGLRNGWSFEGHGFPYQPMKKELNK
jgi:GNAT superfamily N-acetyltransferase